MRAAAWLSSWTRVAVWSASATAVCANSAEPLTCRPISWTEEPSSSAAAATVLTFEAASSAAAATVVDCARRLRGGAGHGAGRRLQLGGRRRDPADDAADRPFEAVGQLDRRALALESGRLIGDAPDLGLLGRLLRDHIPDALDRAADRADLIAAHGLGNLRVDLTLGHAPKNADETVERARDPDNDDGTEEAEGGEEANPGDDGEGLCGCLSDFARAPLFLSQSIEVLSDALIDRLDNSFARGPPFTVGLPCRRGDIAFQDGVDRRPRGREEAASSGFSAAR